MGPRISEDTMNIDETRTIILTMNDDEFYTLRSTIKHGLSALTGKWTPQHTMAAGPGYIAKVEKLNETLEEYSSDR